MDNGVHVVTGCRHESGGTVETTIDRVTRPILFTSLTNLMGFVAMLRSSHYFLEFLGWAMLAGMAAPWGSPSPRFRPSYCSWSARVLHSAFGRTGLCPRETRWRFIVSG